MRARLVVMLTIPIALLFILLGAAYAMSVAESRQQALYLDRLSDVGYLALTARQSLTTDDPALVAAELERYGEVYGIGAAVLNQAGDTWATNGLDVELVDERFEALAGRRFAPDERLVPWLFGDLVVAEPVYDSGDLIGAVVTSSGTDEVAREVGGIWLALGTGALVSLGFSAFVANWLASWVLRPVRMVDDAMGEMRRGHMGARIPESSGPPELKQVVAQFNQMAEKVEHLVHKQQEFVSNASHELRNPLNALLLRVEDLGMSLPAEPSEELEHVRAEGRRMASILDALLILARDEDLTPGAEPVDFTALVERRVVEWRPLASGQDVAVELASAGPIQARVDEIAMESALDAVLDNAVKFAPPGSVVEVALAVHDRACEVTVRDYGPGVNPDEIDKMTDRFWRSPRHGAVRGSGLGLAIAAELMASCGGGLRLALADGGGLAVTLWTAGGDEANAEKRGLTSAVGKAP